MYLIPIEVTQSVATCKEFLGESLREKFSRSKPTELTTPFECSAGFEPATSSLALK